MAVDAIFAQWLQDVALFSLRENATMKARWGETAIVAERVSAIATQADAEAEGDRQLGFFSGPLAEDSHVLPIIDGGWVQHIGQVITLTYDGLGYDDGVDVFLIAAEDDHAIGLSTLTVLMRL
jgi:hypothetical protein